MISAHFLRSTLAAVLMGLSTIAVAQAQSYPERSIKVVVPFPAGGPTDAVARLVVQQLSSRLGQTVYVENQASAGGRVASHAVARAHPDGYTLLLGGTNTNAVPRAFYKDLPYDPLKDFAAVAALASDSPVLVVNPALPASTLPELVRYAKDNPGKLTGGAAVGIYTHFWMELLRIRTGADMLFVPYKGAAPVLTDILAGTIQVTVAAKSFLLPHIQAGRLRAIAVASSARWPELADVPTMHESGFDGFPSEVLFGLVAPAATPAAIIARLNGATNDTLKSAETQGSFAKLGINPVIGSAQDFAAILARDAAAWEEAAKVTGIRLD